VPWSGYINGFPIHVDISYLGGFLGPRWLSTEQLNMVMHLIHLELVKKGCNDVKIIKETTMFHQKLLEAYHAQRTSIDALDTYTNANHYRWIRDSCQALQTGQYEQLAFLVNLNDNHWVSVVINGHTDTIFYGDSLGSDVDPTLRDALRWWTHLHTGRDFVFEELPITRQTDGHSCGLMACNAIEAWVLHKPAIYIDPDCALEERLRMFVRIVQRHFEEVR
ncbi:cysteine proteinase, partial [Dendrothele bispora CBS 962.96]